MKRALIRLFSAAATLTLLVGTGGVAHAQKGGVAYGERPSVPSKYRRAIEDYKMLKQRPTEDIRQVEARPILDAAGRHLVGIVQKRTLTKSQLDLRVNLILKRLPEIQDPKEAKDRQINLEGRILGEWTRATVLAVLAESLGYKATDQEVNQAIQDLSAKSSADPSQAIQQIVGIPDADLKQEVADAIVIEKMMRNHMNQVKDDALQRVFQRDPDVFLEPTRVKAWHLVAPMVNSPTDDQLKTLKKTMAKMGKRLSKCREQEDYLALQKELGQDKGILLVYLDDVASNEPLKADMLNALFGLKPGKTSDVIATPPPPSKPVELHVVKVLERTEGHRGTFEEAKPQVQNFLIEKLKEVTYENVLNQEKFDIRTDPAGLNEYREIARIPARPAPAVAAAPATPPPPARLSLRGAPTLPGQRTGGILTEPPPVETVIGAKAEPVAPAAIGTAPASRTGILPGQPGTLPRPTAAATAKANLLAPVGGDPATSAAGLDAAPVPAEPQPLLRRRRRTQPTRNYNVNPPAVGEVLTREQREGGN